MSDTAIRTDGLTRLFGALRAVDGVSLDVPAGIVFGFLGPNGAGKTTTIRLLLGLLEPSEGRAEVLGFDTRTQAADIRARCGALLEHPGLYERLTAWENLDFYGRINHMAVAERSRRARELLSRFQLWERRDERVAKWSRGMKQKLAIARALLHGPPVLFLDEPTAGLDALAAASLRQEVAELARSDHVTVFLTTHNLAEAEQLCALVAICREGRVVTVGAPNELRARVHSSVIEIAGRGFTEQIIARVGRCPDVVSSRMDHRALRLELREGADAAPLVALLVEGGVEIEEVRKMGASLEAAFLSALENAP